MSGAKHIKEIIQLIESIQSGREIIVEARHDDNFKQAAIGIKNLVKDSSISNTMEAAIDTVGKTFFRIIKQDGFKILPSAWKLFLSDMAISSLYSIVMDEIEKSKEDTGINIGKLKQKIDKLKQKNDDLNDVFEGSVTLMRYAELLYHYNGISYQKIKDVNPYVKSISSSFRTTLSRLEDEFKEISSELIVIDDDAEMILDMGQYKWYLLDRVSCDLEGIAMGHCGNTGSPKSGDQILSLRQIVKYDGQEYYRPSLTFIINNGILGEMKGRANSKPANKYHTYIMSLLKLPMIKGIRGGGYKPEANFDLADLSEEQRNELVEIKGEDFLERKTIFNIIGKKYKETGVMTRVDVIELDDELTETHGIHSSLLGTNRSGKFVIDIEDAIEDTKYKGYVFDDEYVDLDPPGVDDYDSYLGYLNEEDYDAVIAYIMNNYEEDIKEYIENEHDDEYEYGLTFVSNNIHDIIENVDIEPIKDAIRTALRHAYESGTMSQMYEAMRKALVELSEEYSITIPTESLYQLADDKYLCIVEPDNFMAFIETFIYYEGVVKLNFKEPYYGFYEFDEEFFKNEEGLREQLVEQGVLD